MLFPHQKQVFTLEFELQKWKTHLEVFHRALFGGIGVRSTLRGHAGTCDFGSREIRNTNFLTT